MFGLAIKGIFSHSHTALRLITLVGLSASALSVLYLIWFIGSAVLVGVPFDSFGTIIVVVLLGFGFSFAALGIIGEYLALIYEEVKRRPNFIVKRTLGF